MVSACRHRKHVERDRGLVFSALYACVLLRSISRDVVECVSAHKAVHLTERTSRRVVERYQTLASVAAAEIGCYLRGVGDPKSETGYLQEAEVYYVDPRSTRDKKRP